MKAIKRMTLAGALLAAGVGAAMDAIAQPAWKPDRAVEIIIGTSPGGPQDQMGRLLLKALQEGRGFEVPVTVVNKPGGGGAVGLADRPAEQRVKEARVGVWHPRQQRQRIRQPSFGAQAFHQGRVRHLTPTNGKKQQQLI